MNHLQRAEQNRREAVELEAEADKARASGNERRARMLYQASSDVAKLAQLHQRDHAREAVGRMEIENVLTD